MWSVGGVQKWSFLDLTQPNIGFPISAQNYLKRTCDMEYTQPMLQNNSRSGRSVLLYPSAGEGKAYPAQMFRHSMKLFFITVWRMCDHIAHFSWLVSVGNSFRSTHLWPRVPWCNSNRGQNCWTQTCSPMFTQTECESSTNTFVLNRWTRRLLALIQKTKPPLHWDLLINPLR